jgi:predicted DNA-binding transcriptional regulator YafY
MRADRLVAVLLLLQTRGRVSAREVAAELEVSEKTARRDLEALAIAGLPVYSQAGRNGGWELLGGGRTDLTGLTASEAQALFQVAGTAATATPEVRAALRKLVRALPETFRAGAETAARSFVIDDRTWGGSDRRARPAVVTDLQRAAIEQRRVTIDYRDRRGSESVRTVDPYGLVAKGATWYLVAGTDDGQRSFRVDRIRSAVVLDERASRPDGFDLASAWEQVRAQVETLRTPIKVRVVAPRWAMHALRGQFAGSAEQTGEFADGTIGVTIGGSHIASLAQELAGWGDLVRVLEPKEVIDELRRIASSITSLYADD